MRPKLLLIASLIAAIVGSGASALIVIVSLRYLNYSAETGQWQRWWRLLFSVYAPLFLAACLGSMFVYRHTARRRKLQAALTLIIALLISLGAQVAFLLLRSTFHI
jgi:hypothetical protein